VMLRIWSVLPPVQHQHVSLLQRQAVHDSVNAASQQGLDDRGLAFGFCLLSDEYLINRLGI
jgi:hypothetical protein